MLDMNMIVDYARDGYIGIYYCLWFYINYSIIYIKVELRPTYFIHKKS